jgi:carboxynorspermidine decarboxylase
LKTPYYLLEEDKLIKNLERIAYVQEKAGVEIILALKGFALWKAFPLISKYVSAVTASSLNEVRLGYEEFGTKTHTYCVAYDPDEFEEIVSMSSHLTFNSIGQLERFNDRIPGDLQIGLRVNPEWSDVSTDLYNPSSSSSRLGVIAEQIKELPKRVDGLHFHVLCESDAKATMHVLDAFEKKFHRFFNQISWINIGGGHLLTKSDYDTDLLIETLLKFQDRTNLKITMEPGGAFVWQAGSLETSVIDIVENGGVKTAIIDASFTCHMPDCLKF